MMFPPHQLPVQPPPLSNPWASLNEKEETKKKNLFTNLPKSTRILLCRISATAFQQQDPEHPAPSCWDLFSDNTAAKVPTHVLEAVRQSGARGSWQHGHLTHMIHQGLIWPSAAEPEGLIFFGIIPYSGYCSKSRQKERYAQIKSSYENI
jgi:hypothetical protein